jgi:hypothetical protein
LIGFPALADAGDAVTLEVFDEPEAAALRHRAGLRRLFALQIRDALKYLEKNIPDLQKMAVAYMGLGTLEELRGQILEVALDRAFLLEPLPTNEADFKRRLDEGRGRLTLIANEVARLAATILGEYALALRKIKDSKNATAAAADCTQQLHGLRCSITRVTSRPSSCDSTNGVRTRPGMPRVWPSSSHKSSAICVCWPSARERATRACRSCAGCSKNCA